MSNTNNLTKALAENAKKSEQDKLNKALQELLTKHAPYSDKGDSSNSSKENKKHG